MNEPTSAAYNPGAEADQLRARILAAAVGTGLLEVLVKSLLDLHRAEPDKISLGHDDCDECDDWEHVAVTCSECGGTDGESYWTPVVWPCPTVQHVADKLRAYPEPIVRAVLRAD